MKIEISDMIARVLQRMIADEIRQQRRWLVHDKKLGCKDTETYRNAIILQLSSLADMIESQGIEKYIKYR